MLESVDLPGGGTAPSKVLYYARARYYDPETVRFISEDPAGKEAI